jgi:soluble lytic murein transglycosylase-like protein
VTAVVAVIGTMGALASWLAGAGLVVFAGVVLAVGIAAAALLWGWLRVRPRMEPMAAVLAAGLGVVALGMASRPGFHDGVASLQSWLGGGAAARRTALAHQVYAAYRRADLRELERVLDRARVFEPTVREAADAFSVDPEVLMGVGAAESSFYPRDSGDGGRGLFQITSPPAEAVAAARQRLGVERLDPLNQRHNAFVAAATLRRYLELMRGDPFLGLLAYNIGPRNGGLVSIMAQYGAHDFVTVQPYLQQLPRDYPIRVLSSALAYRLWRADGHLPHYEDGDNARRIQQMGIPGLDVGDA